MPLKTIDIHFYPEGVIAIIVVIVCVLFLFEALFGRAPKYRYKAQNILTANELEFFGRLQRAAPDLYFFPQVAMSALVTPIAEDSKLRAAAFRRISQKRVDYVKPVGVTVIQRSALRAPNQAL